MNPDPTTTEGQQEIGRRLAELTVPKPWKHGISVRHYGDENFKSCSKCANAELKHCTAPDPIPVSDSDECMGVAMRMLRDCESKKPLPWSIKRQLPGFAARKHHQQDIDFWRWIGTKSTAPQILLIVLLALESPKN